MGMIIYWDICFIICLIEKFEMKKVNKNDVETCIYWDHLNIKNIFLFCFIFYFQ